MSLRICIIGERSEVLDEGMKNIAHYFVDELSNRHDILFLNVKDILYINNFWRKLKKFEPQIIHYVPGPSLMSFIIAKLCSKYSNGNNRVKVVLSAYHPTNFSIVSKLLIPAMRPDIVLVQSWETEKKFISFGCRIKFLPIGVDIDRFKPATYRVKMYLRKKYELENNKFVILHVGHIKKGRNLDILGNLQGDENQVIIVGSTSTKADINLYKKLTEKGCIVFRKYFKNIAEIYALSDCYVFPTTDRQHSVETPLSVLEAMSCNLPVITTKFGALPRIFNEGHGLIFAKKDSDFYRSIEKIKNGEIKVKTREKVKHYSWKNIVNELEKIYADLVRY